MKLVEVQITQELKDDLRDCLFQQGHRLAVGDITTPEGVQAEFTRRSDEATKIAAELLDIITRRAIKPLDLDVQTHARLTLKR